MSGRIYQRPIVFPIGPGEPTAEEYLDKEVGCLLELMRLREFQRSRPGILEKWK